MLCNFLNLHINIFLLHFSGLLYSSCLLVVLSKIPDKAGMAFIKIRINNRTLNDGRREMLTAGKMLPLLQKVLLTTTGILKIRLK